MTRLEVDKRLQQITGHSPRVHTIGQVYATVRDHGGCVLVYDLDGPGTVAIIGRSVPRTADTTVIVNFKTY